jgi:hypothetical protein
MLNEMKIKIYVDGLDKELQDVTDEYEDIHEDELINSSEIVEAVMERLAGLGVILLDGKEQYL